MGQIYTAGPNEALVISGGCLGRRRKKTVVGGWTVVLRHVTNVQCISLNIMTLTPKGVDVLTKEGVPVNVTTVAQVKIIQESGLLEIACGLFLGKTLEEIGGILLQTLEGHLRAILGILTVEEIYRDRDRFAMMVRQVATPDIGKMGIEILSFVIKDINDQLNYLDSLGNAQIAYAKRDADIGVSIADRDAGIKESECDRVCAVMKCQTEAAVKDSVSAYQTQKSIFDQQINAKRAEAELAYSLQEAKENQLIRREQLQIEIIEREKLVEVEDREIVRCDKELASTVRAPAEAENYRIQLIAEAAKTAKLLTAQADAEKVKMIGEAEAQVIEAIGRAEAESMRQKAAAYKQYGDAALMSIILEAMPRIAAEISAPLGKTDEIVIINEDQTCGVSKEVTKLIGTLTPTVQALTGVDLKKVLGTAFDDRLT